MAPDTQKRADARFFLLYENVSCFKRHTLMQILYGFILEALHQVANLLWFVLSCVKPVG